MKSIEAIEALKTGSLVTTSDLRDIGNGTRMGNWVIKPCC